MTWKLAVIVATLATAATVSTQVLSTPKATPGEKGLTQVAGLKVGHVTLSERPTGCTVVLVDGAGAVGGVSQRGAAPGTRETDLLDPLNMVERVNAIVLTGGSAYGLDAAQGVVRYLEEHKIGYPIAGTVVPIVPAAVLMDLGFGGSSSIRPTADCGYRAATSATDGPVAEGNIGAGAGATVGKLLGSRDRAMKAGIGSASISLPNGLVVGAIAAVNAVGDVIDPSTGTVVAGVRTDDGKRLADARALLRSPLPARRRTSTRWQHDDCDRRDQRAPDEVRDQPSCADGRRWPVESGVALAYDRRWGHGVLTRDRDVAGAGRRHNDRRARGRRALRSHRTRRCPGHIVWRPPCRARSRHRALAVQVILVIQNAEVRMQKAEGCGHCLHSAF